MTNKALDDLRMEVDILDIQLINILANRFSITRQIGKLKKQDGLKTIDSTRHAQILALWQTQANNKNISKELALQIIEAIHNQVLLEHEAS